MGLLEGRVVLVTGASGGLGKAVVERFLDEGARVTGVARSWKGRQAKGILALEADMATRDGAASVARSVLEQEGRIDALAHLVGGFEGGSIVGQEPEGTWERMFSINFFSALHAVRAVLPAMKEQGYGRIAAVSARAALLSPAGLGAYSASKAALNSLIRTVAAENKALGITANVVLPGIIDTEANRAAMPEANFNTWVRPETIAAALVSLLSPESAATSGAEIPVWGGS